MIKSFVKKAIEKYAKATTNCSIIWLWHAPKAPRTLISK